MPSICKGLFTNNLNGALAGLLFVQNQNIEFPPQIRYFAILTLILTAWEFKKPFLYK
jgi:hypothetical protein